MSFFSAVVFFLSAHYVAALENGVGRTPSMGWNPYNAFGCDTTVDDYKRQGQEMIGNGMRSAGYNYIILDCGWQGTERDNGVFTTYAPLFPDGIAPLIRYVHELGFKFGVYADAGYYSCGPSGRLGNLGFEAQDAALFASWGMDYIKYDNCFSDSQTNAANHHPTIDIKPHFSAMRDALAAVNRTVIYSMCEWGVQDVARWGESYGNSWRMSDDIGNSWTDVVRIINQLVPITGFAKPGAFNDLDLLEVGNGVLTLAEQQTHFAFWAAAKSPLIVSTKLPGIAADTLAIITNPRIIALNQDPLGLSIRFMRRYAGSHDVWAGPLADGTTVVLVINWGDSTRDVPFDLADTGFASANATNVYTDAPLGFISGTYNTAIEAHGVLVLKLADGVAAPAKTFTSYSASSFVLSGGAATGDINGTTYARFVGTGDNTAGVLTINNVDGGSGGTKTLSIDFINADYVLAYEKVACRNCREALISVNGAEGVTANFPLSGQSWDLQAEGFLVDVPGFTAGATNTITISNPNGWAPDFVRIGVSA